VGWTFLTLCPTSPLAPEVTSGASLFSPNRRVQVTPPRRPLAHKCAVRITPRYCARCRMGGPRPARSAPDRVKPEWQIWDLPQGRVRLSSSPAKTATVHRFLRATGKPARRITMGGHPERQEAPDAGRSSTARPSAARYRGHRRAGRRRRGWTGGPYRTTSGARAAGVDSGRVSLLR
jgi:hypothetical protein